MGGEVNDCIFCQIIAKKVQARFEYENDHLVAIQDMNPQAPVHLLIIPKKHMVSIQESEKADASLLGSMVLCAKELARQRQVEDGYRLVLNNGAKAGQSVFHVHLHLLGGKK